MPPIKICDHCTNEYLGNGICGDQSGQCRNSNMRPGADHRAQKKVYRKIRARAYQDGTLTGAPPPAPGYAGGGAAASSSWGGGAAGSAASAESSQPPSSLASDTGATDGSDTTLSFGATTPGVPGSGHHGWRLQQVDELAAAADAQAAEEDVESDVFPQNPAAPAQQEIVPAEGIDRLTDLLVGPVAEALQSARWGVQLTNPRAREVVMNLIRYVWSEHGPPREPTGGSQ